MQFRERQQCREEVCRRHVPAPSDQRSTFSPPSSPLRPSPGIKASLWGREGDLETALCATTHITPHHNTTQTFVVSSRALHAVAPAPDPVSSQPASALFVGHLSPFPVDHRTRPNFRFSRFSEASSNRRKIPFSSLLIAKKE